MPQPTYVYAYTQLKYVYYPGFFNFSRNDDGSFVLIAREPEQGGTKSVTLQLPPEAIVELRSALNKLDL